MITTSKPVYPTYLVGHGYCLDCTQDSIALGESLRDDDGLATMWAVSAPTPDDAIRIAAECEATPTMFTVLGDELGTVFVQEGYGFSFYDCLLGKHL